MIRNRFLTGFLFKILIVSCLTLMFYSSEVRAAGSPADEDPEFMSEMNEYLRHPDEPDIYPDDHLGVPDSDAETQDTNPSPNNTGEIEEDLGEGLNFRHEITNTPENDETRIARPSANDETRIARPGDPEPESPVEPDTLSGEFIDVIDVLLESDWAAVAGVIVIFVLVGLGTIKTRKKIAATVRIQNAATGSPTQRRTATASFQMPGSTPLDQKQMKCSQCDLVISANHKFCTGCGALIPAIVEKTTPPLEQNTSESCTSCGALLQPDVLFCTNCGKKI